MPLKLLFATAYYPPYSIGGAEESTLLLAKALRERGHGVAVLAPRLGDRPPEADGLVETVEVGLRAAADGSSPPAKSFDRPWVQARFARAVEQRAREADLVHCQALHVLPGTYAGARRAKTPIVASIRDLGGVCSVNVCLLDHPRVPSDCGVRKLETECIPRFHEIYGGRSRVRLQVSGLLYFGTARGRSRILNRCDAVLPVAADLGGVYADAGLVDRSRVRVLPTVAQLNGSAASGPDAEHGFAFYAGKVSTGKGFDHLLAAVTAARREEPGFRLVVAGGAEPNWAERLAAAEGVDFLGRLPRAALAGHYRDARFAVVPSIWPEPFPRAVLEAAVSGVAVIGTRAGGIPEAIEDERTGLLVPPRDAGALAAAMLRLWRDPALARRLGETARREIGARFAPEVVSAQAESVYDDVLAAA